MDIPPIGVSELDIYTLGQVQIWDFEERKQGC